MRHLKSILIRGCLLLSGMIALSNRTDAQAQNKTDSLEAKMLEEVVITASKQEENILQSPVSIEKMDSTAIQQSAQPGFFDAIQNLKGL